MQNFLKSRRIILPVFFATLGAALMLIFVPLALGQDKDGERAALEARIAEIEAEIAALDGDLVETREQKRTLENEIYRLNTQIRRAELAISGLNLSIGQTEKNIGEQEVAIDQTSLEIERRHSALAEYLRTMHKYTDRSLVEVLLATDLSNFFQEVSVLEGLQEDAQVNLGYLKALKAELEQRRELLSERRVELLGLRSLEQLERQNIAAQKSQKNSLLSQTKGEEAKYQKLISSRQQEVAALRARIFNLAGTQAAPTFGEAVEIAEWASGMTGIRSAFLLAILTQESNIGRNVGQCNILANPPGAAVSTRTGQTFKNGMHPTRDLPLFLQIASSLGIDPYTTPVSCPIPSVGGYGGAMGPAQFIPSTWAHYENRTSTLLGRTANPWNIRDSFLASAVFLSDLGASKQTRSAELCAALSYFSGRCNTRYSFYGSSVLAIADKYEEEIKLLKGL